MLALFWATFSDCLSSVIAIGTISFLALSPIIIYKFLVRQWLTKAIWLKGTRDKYGALYVNLYLKNKASLLHNPVFCARRFILACSAIYLTVHGFAQIQVLLFLTSLIVIYNGLVEPFMFKYLAYLELFNELSIIVVGYHLVSFTDFVPDKET